MKKIPIIQINKPIDKLTKKENTQIKNIIGGLKFQYWSKYILEKINHFHFKQNTWKMKNGFHTSNDILDSLIDFLLKDSNLKGMSIINMLNIFQNLKTITPEIKLHAKELNLEKLKEELQIIITK